MGFVASLCVLSMCINLIHTVDTLEHKQRSRRLEHINSDMLQNIVQKSDMTKFKEILKPMMIERVAGTEGNVKVREHIKRQMNDLGWFVEEDQFEDTTPFGLKQFTNVIATQTNSAKKRTLTLACHFDSKYFSNFKFIGATDSAVPCAMLIDLARTLKDSFEKSTKVTEVTLQFIFFDGEEAFQHWSNTDSTYGARHLAKVLSKKEVEVSQEIIVPQIKSMDVLVLLDLIGAKDPKFTNWFPRETGTLYEELRSIETILTKTENLVPKKRPANSFYFTGQHQFGGGIQDDHIPFLKRGVRVLHLIPYPFPSVWHRELDNEHALDYDTIDNLNKILRVFVYCYLHL